MFNSSLTSPSASHANIAMSAATNTSHSELRADWEKWKKDANPGIGEERDTAIQRLIHCLERGEATLDLSNLKLTKLPPSMPGHITQLNVDQNQLKELPENLPDKIEFLYAFGNPDLEQVPDRLPNSLMILDIYSCNINKLPETWPPHMIKLDAHHNALRDYPVLMTSLPGHIHIDISVNPLNSDAFQKLDAAIKAAHYQGPTIIMM